MTCKGVYASLGFSIYITKDELHDLLLLGEITGTAYIGKTQISKYGVDVRLSDDLSNKLLRAYGEDKEAIRQAKSSMRSGFLGRKRTDH